MSNLSKPFRTVIEPAFFDFHIDHRSKLLFIGSCFSENIGTALKNLKYQVDLNPFGILYNPVSTANSFKILLEKRMFTEKDLIFHNELWHSFFHHGHFSGLNKEDVLEGINERIKDSSVFLKAADFVFITFGTAWVYRYIETKQIVSNCHKIPNKEFERSLIDLNEVTEIYRNLTDELIRLNPKLKIIFTLSPVRHLKEGFIQNFLSKSLLRLLINNLTEKRPELHYFPAYEILIDDLRDYRFYNEDMLHPNSEAVQYVFDYFSACFFKSDTVQLNEKIIKINRSLEHKPFFKNTKEYLKFIKKTKTEIEKLQREFPFIDLSDELKRISSK